MANRIIRIILLLLFLVPCPVWADILICDSCSVADISAKLSIANEGDTVVVPSGECTWTGGSGVTISTANITLSGAGLFTVITHDGTNGYLLSLSATGVDVSGLSFRGSENTNTSDHMVKVNSSGGNFRLTALDFNRGGDAYTMGYSICVDYVYGVIDNCTFDRVATETIFVRGPCDSWQTASSIGGADNVFVENCSFTYVAGYGGTTLFIDCNANSRTVVRYNNINGYAFDAHGKCSNYNNCDADHRGARHYEVYNNAWTLGDLAPQMQLRGGTGVIHHNTVARTGRGGTGPDPYVAGIALRDYATNQTNCFGYDPSCACAADYPLDDQIGVGIDPKSAGSEPLYIWANTENGEAIGGVHLQDPSSTCSTNCGDGATGEDFFHSGTDFVFGSAKPGYSCFTCPHPRTGLPGTCDPNTAGRGGYNVGAGTTKNFTIGGAGTNTFTVGGGGTHTFTVIP